MRMQDFGNMDQQMPSMKNNFIGCGEELLRRDDMIEVDGSQIMSRSVFVASGHLDNFTDPIIKCKNCGATFRADRYITTENWQEVQNYFLEMK